MKFTLLLLTTLLVAVPKNASAHCQIPCGIFDDNNVIGSMQTDLLTIEKACTELASLSKEPSANAQQIVRWTVNKEKHAQDLQEKVLNYFLAQRLKAPETDAENDAYLAKLKLCHEVIIAAMKCKHSTDLANVEKLRGLMERFATDFGAKK